VIVLVGEGVSVIVAVAVGGFVNIYLVESCIVDARVGGTVNGFMEGRIFGAAMLHEDTHETYMSARNVTIIFFIAASG
jgi:hypothetical protein